jgi:hypothetical protein
MSIKDKYSVSPIPSKETYDWLLKKHYAHRIPNIIYAFGLYDNKNILQGICTYGMPPMPSTDFISNEIKMNDILELNRLCKNDNLEKNVLSFFITRTFKILPKNIILLSYADPNKNHHGYIYQTTNWLYTGLGAIGVKTYIFDNREIHPRHLNKKEFFIPKKLFYDDNLTKDENFIKIDGKIISLKPKHRYILINGDKKFKKKIIKSLNVKILPYPKGDNKRYDTSYNPDIQGKLF